MSAQITFNQDPSKISSFVSEEDYESAFLWAEAFFLHPSVDQERIEEVCSQLESLLPSLSIDKQEILLQKACEKVSEFPNLRTIQANLLASYGELSFEKGSPLIAVMRSFTTSCSLNPDEKLYKRMSELLKGSSLPFVRFERQLQQAAGRAQVDEFERLLNLIPSLHQKFSEQNGDIKRFYQRARDIYQELNERSKAQFLPFLDLITSKLRTEVPLDPNRSLVARYRERLASIRALYRRDGEIRALQRARAQAFREFFASLFDDAFYILGEPPCKYEIRAMGSLAREENCPFSDIEYYILIESEEHRPYFHKLAELFDLQILSLGETDPKYQSPMFSTGQKPGLEIDHQANPAYNEGLIGTPDRLFALPDDSDADSLKAYKSRLQSVSILGNHSFGIPQHDLSDYAKAVLDMRQEEFGRLRILQGNECSIKQEFMEPLFHYLGDLGLYYGLQEKNTLDLIEKLPPFTRLSKKLLKEAATSLYQLRVELHLESRAIQEEASLVPSLELPVLSAQEKMGLARIHQLLLVPLYRLNLQETRVDFLATIFRQPTVELVQSATQFLQSQPLKVHERYYRMLSSPSHAQFQEAYLEKLPKKWASRLAKIPNRAGYRLSRKKEERDLKRMLSRITTSKSTTGVKISSPLLEKEIYLRSDAAKTLLNRNGRLKKKYSDSLHNVNEFGGLHFKELPYQPLMEYAIYSLIHRIMGKAAPATTLARLEIPGKNLVYPVLVSETIVGERVDPKTPLNQDHLTWLRLCELLTKPGDGRPSNYVVKEGKVYCVDNDISFMEPVYKAHGKRKVAFTSTLFTLDVPLSPEVLEAFCQLEPDLILKDWLEELQKREEEYLSLFPNTEELQLLYEQDRDRRFSPTLLLAKGTLATLCLQFYQLQDSLRNKSLEDPLLLLTELISLEGAEKNQVGPLVERSYRKALARPFEKRVAEATSSRQDQSMTSQKAMELNYKKIPTFDEILERKTYSLQEAFQELCLLEVQKLWNEVFVVQKGGEFTLEADFHDVVDPEREKLLLKGIQLLYETKGSKPTSLTLRNTKTLTPNLLRSLLHPDLLSLDLSYGSFVQKGRSYFMDLLYLIESSLPNLEELHLERCVEVQRLTLNLRNMKKVNVSHSPTLTSLTIHSAEILELRINHCPELQSVIAPLQVKTSLDFKETPKLQDPLFLDQLFLFGKKYAEGDRVPQNLNRAITYWEKGALHLHGNSQIQLRETYYKLGLKHSKGEGVPEDLDKAMELWSKAAALAHEEAREEKANLIEAWYQKGNQLASGEGEPQDIEKTIELYEKAAAYGHIGAKRARATLGEKLFQLGIQHAEGEQVPRDTKKAIVYWTKAAELGHHDAQVIVGRIEILEEKTRLDVGDSRAYEFISLEDSGAYYLAHALKVNETVTDVDIGENEIRLPGAESLAVALKVNSTVLNLNLRRNQFGDRGVQAIAEGLRTNQGVRTLNLSGNYIESGGFRAISETLRVTQVLSTLILKNINFAYDDFCLFAEVMRHNKTLKELELEEAGIENRHVLALSEALKTNETLLTLSLGNGCSWSIHPGKKNTVDNQGGRAFAEALKTNYTLETLDLTRNEIGNKGAIAFAEVLPENHSLRVLKLSDNKFELGDPGWDALLDLLKTREIKIYLESSWTPIKIE